MRIRRCPAAVKRRFAAHVSQNTRQDSKRRGSYECFDESQPPAAGWCDFHSGISRPFPVQSSPCPSPLRDGRQHRPFGSAGIVEWHWSPLLGPDHLLFLLAIAFIGLQRPRAWVIPLLAAGLSGSVLSQFIPLPDAVAPWAEALVSLSLVVEGLMALTVASASWLLPLVALHGFLLGSTIVGAEPTPLATYFLGLLIGQGALLLVVTSWSQSLLERIGAQGQRLGAGIWMGIGMAFAWVALID